MANSEHRGVTVEGIRRVVDWLDSEQDPEAVVSHHGVGTRLGDFYVSITPQPPYGGVAGVVLIFEVAEEARVYDRAVHPPDLLNGIPPDERDALQALVEQVVPVHHAWNGLSVRNVTCSFCIDKEPGEGVRQAKANYVAFDNSRESVVGIAPPSVRGDH